ncbi:MAG: DNA ligase D [Candidatus Nanopelagicales bacterium]
MAPNPELREYRRKRDFSSTPEPAGASGPVPADARRFVVQRHRATRLHYDFRLEIGGVLVSWAVPKGPTLDPKIKRMAVHVEDHPLEYFQFEGVIPAGQYGGGDVIVWDWGTWEPEPPATDPQAALAAGELKFRLHGEKVNGRFTIVRTSGRGGEAGEDKQQEQWLLIHKNDEFAAPGWQAEDHPRSVKSGLTNDEVKAGAQARRTGQAPAAAVPIDLSAAVEAPPPRFVEPMMATLTKTCFAHPDWLFEVKWDGYRLQAHVTGGEVKLYTRNGNDADTYFGGLLSPVDWIGGTDAVLDGEMVALDAAGRPDFGLLQEQITLHKAGRPTGLIYQVFDLLYLDGRSLLQVPLEERKKLLKVVLRDRRHVHYADHVVENGMDFFAAAAAAELEGVVAKRRRSRYEPGGRSSAWLKIKIRPEQDLVVGGWTPATGNPRALGALVVGVYRGSELRYTGKVGTGFDESARRELLSKLGRLTVAEPPFAVLPGPDRRGRWGGDLSGVTWVNPDLVIRAELGGWTREGLVRQASFKGLDPGRDPREAVRERAVATPAGITTAAPASPQVRSSHLDPSLPPTGHPVSAADLATLAGLPENATWELGGQSLKLTNLGKVLFPPAGEESQPITKLELIGYYAQVATYLLPHLADRPLNLHRFPNGVGSAGFWQKNLPASTPGWLTIWHETGFREGEAREANDHLIADSAAALVWLANQAAFEIHAWTATRADPWMPTFALIDIDPGPATTWEETLTLARLYRTAFTHLGVTAFPKTTGSRGLQAWVPLVRGKYTYQETSAWVEKLSRAIGETVPELVSWVWTKKDRGGKARLDYTQNAPIKTLVAPYSVRPRPGAPVSMPIRWEELDDPDLRSERWNIRNALPRLAEVGDLFAGAAEIAQVLPRL